MLEATDACSDLGLEHHAQLPHELRKLSELKPETEPGLTVSFAAALDQESDYNVKLL